jgi:hypothetical protein
MNQNWCDKKDYRIFILGIIFVSFGITVPVEIILLISKKINYFLKIIIKCSTHYSITENTCPYSIQTTSDSEIFITLTSFPPFKQISQ